MRIPYLSIKSKAKELLSDFAVKVRQHRDNARNRKLTSLYAAQHPLCERCLVNMRVTVMAEVHHINPLPFGDSEHENLLSLCLECHGSIDKLSQDEQRTMKQN